MYQEQEQVVFPAPGTVDRSRGVIIFEISKDELGALEGLSVIHPDLTQNQAIEVDEPREVFADW